MEMWLPGLEPCWLGLWALALGLEVEYGLLTIDLGSLEVVEIEEEGERGLVEDLEACRKGAPALEVAGVERLEEALVDPGAPVDPTLLRPTSPLALDWERLGPKLPLGDAGGGVASERDLLRVFAELTRLLERLYAGDALPVGVGAFRMSWACEEGDCGTMLRPMAAAGMEWVEDWRLWDATLPALPLDDLGGEGGVRRELRDVREAGSSSPSTPSPIGPGP